MTKVLFSCIALVLHEAAHLAAAWALGVRIKRIGLSRKGPYIVRETGTVPVNVAISLAGPFLNLMLALMWRVSPEFGLINLVLGATNLLPVLGSDGERVLKAIRGREVRVPVRAQ